MIERIQDGYRLSTGREVSAHYGFIGIPAIHWKKDDIREFAEGYDGEIVIQDPALLDYYQKQEITWLLTTAEAIEICDSMILAWKHRRKLLLMGTK